MSENLKILVAGDVEGQYDTLFKRVSTLNSKSGPFDMLLCVGEFFLSNPVSEDQLEAYKIGEKKVPIPTFILGPAKQQHQRFFRDLKGCELCHNLTYLGDHGIFSGSTGLKLAYVSGKERLTSESKDNFGFSAETVKSIEVQVANNPGIDILLTSQWPQGVEKFGNTLEGNDSFSFGSSLLSRLAQKIKPRYHFCGLEGIHYERLPYRNHEVLQEKSLHVTRFIALAKVGNASKLKWLYAFNLIPMKRMQPDKLAEQPAGTTPCPYVLKNESSEASYSTGETLSNQYFYDVSEDVMSGNVRGTKRKQNSQGRSNRPPPKPMGKSKHEEGELSFVSTFFPTGPCWFCLSSPEVEKHLVVSVGEHCYVALPKGPLVPEHVLILPIGHYQSLLELPEEVLEEVEKFKIAISRALQKKSKSAVFF